MFFSVGSCRPRATTSDTAGLDTDYVDDRESSIGRMMISGPQHVTQKYVASRGAAFECLFHRLGWHGRPAGDREQIAATMAAHSRFQEGDDPLCYVTASTCVHVITLASRTFHCFLPALSGPFDIAPHVTDRLSDRRRKPKNYPFLRVSGNLGKMNFPNLAGNVAPISLFMTMIRARRI